MAERAPPAPLLALPYLTVPYRVLLRRLFAVVNFLVAPVIAAGCGVFASLQYIQGPGDIRPIFDDSYISLTFARHLAETGKLTFDGLTWSTGATSPLHVALMALPIKLGADPMAVGTATGVISHVALTVMVYALGYAVFRTRLAGLLGAVAIAFCSYAVLDSGNGLETSLFMAVSAAAMASFFLFRSWWGCLLTSLLIGLAVLTRPEGAFLLPAAVLYRWMDRQPGERLLILVRDVFLLSLLAAGAGAFLAGLSWSVNGDLGGTASAKMAFFQENTLSLSEKMRIATDNVGLFLGPVVLLVALAGVGAQRKEATLFALFVVPILILHALLFPGGMAHYFYRYQHPILPLLAVLAGGGAAHLITQAIARDLAAKVLVVAALAVVVLTQFYQFERWEKVYMQNSRESIPDLERMAAELNIIIKPGEVLATHDIGIHGYYGRYEVLDLVGLVNPDVIPYHEERKTSEYFKDARPDYYLMFPEWDWYFMHVYPGSKTDQFELVREFPVRHVPLSPYILYRIKYPETQASQ